MTNLARKYEHQFANGSIDIEQIAVQKDQDHSDDKTAWIFEDGSALTLCGNEVGIVADYGLHPDHEQLY